MTLFASSGPMSTCTALTVACSAFSTTWAPRSGRDAPSSAPTAIVDGTSVRTAKNAISAAWPVVRWALADAATCLACRQTQRASRPAKLESPPTDNATAAPDGGGFGPAHRPYPVATPDRRPPARHLAPRPAYAAPPA